MLRKPIHHNRREALTWNPQDKRKTGRPKIPALKGGDILYKQNIFNGTIK